MLHENRLSDRGQQPRDKLPLIRRAPWQIGHDRQRRKRSLRDIESDVRIEKLEGAEDRLLARV